MRMRLILNNLISVYNRCINNSMRYDISYISPSIHTDCINGPDVKLLNWKEVKEWLYL